MLCQQGNATTSTTGVDVVTTSTEEAEEVGPELESPEDVTVVHPPTDKINKHLLQQMMTLFGLHFHLQRKMINDSM